MIKNSQNLVIICGMAHTGTTVIAHILRQHPGITLVNNGSMAYILENDYLLDADETAIEQLLAHGDRVLLKRPWVEYHQTDWLIQHFPDAYYIYCLKEKERTIKSWSAPNSYVSEEFRNRSYDEKSKAYDDCFDSAMRLKDGVNKFISIDNGDVIEKPKEIFSNINHFLGLNPFEYDLSDISSSKPIKNLFVLDTSNKTLKSRIINYLRGIKNKK